MDGRYIKFGILIVCLISDVRIRAVTKSSYWRRNSSIPMDEFGLLFNVSCETITECAIRCSVRDDCWSVTFESSARTCNGYTWDKSGTTAADRYVEFFYKMSRGADCIGSGYNYESSLDLCYQIYGDDRTHADASNKCQSEGARLAIIDTVPKLDVFAEAIKPLIGFVTGWMYAHIGGDNLLNETQWIWWNGQNVSMSTDFWFPWEPNNPTFARCLTLHIENGKFNDFHCNNERPYICQKFVW